MPRKSKYDSSFKAKVAIEAIKESKTLPELAVEYGVSPNKIVQWKRNCSPMPSRHSRVSG